MEQTNVLKLACIGECMVELQESGPGLLKQTFGGDTLNTAIYCARLAHLLPLQVDYVTALGCDRFSREMIRFMEQEGVGSKMIQKVHGENPGLYYIELDEFGERVFHYWRSDSAAKKCFDYPGCESILKELSQYGAIYLSGISLAILTKSGKAALIARLRDLSAQGVAIAFDCNYRPNLWRSVEEALTSYEQLFTISKLVFLTTEEAEILFEGLAGKDVHDSLQQYGVEESVIKNGEEPCSIYVDGRIIEVAAFPVKQVIDTTAAGDSFSAIYLLARCFGQSAQEAAKLAHATAAYVVEHRGALAPRDKMPVSGKDITKGNRSSNQFRWRGCS